MPRPIHYKVEIKLPVKPERRQQMLTELAALRKKFGRKFVGQPIEILHSRERSLEASKRRERDAKLAGPPAPGSA